MKPKRIQRKRTKGYQAPEGAIYVGRPSKWGNPFPVGSELGDVPYRLVKAAGLDDYPVDTHIMPSMAAALYREWLRGELKDDPSFLRPLKGKDLICWCHSSQPCHADVLLEFANGEVN